MPADLSKFQCEQDKLKKAWMARDEDLLATLLMDFDNLVLAENAEKEINLELLENILNSQWEDSNIVFDTVHLLEEFSGNFATYRHLILNSLDGLKQAEGKTGMIDIINQSVSGSLFTLYQHFEREDLPALKTMFQAVSNDYSKINLASVIYLVSEEEFYLEFISNYIIDTAATMETEFHDGISIAGRRLKFLMQATGQNLLEIDTGEVQ